MDSKIDGKEWNEETRPAASQKYFNAAPLELNFKNHTKFEEISNC